LADRIYLDHAATTPILPEARQAVAEAMACWANPSSPHAEGRAARAMLEDARRRLANALGWHGKVVFTSGASEAIEIVMQRAAAGERFASTTEHPAVLRCTAAGNMMPVRTDGTLEIDDLNRLLTASERPLIAVQQVNSETGVIQPTGRIAEQVRAAGGLLLCDCAQGAGKLPLPEADFVVVAAHKLGGPPGVGALLVRDGSSLAAVGGQEGGYRPGTPALPLIMGFAAAAEANRSWFTHAADLRVRLEQSISESGGETIAAAAPRVPTIGAYRLPGVSAAAQLMHLDLAGIAVSAGSACSSGSVKTSHVLLAMGMEERAASEVIRVSFGWSTTAADVDAFLDQYRLLAGRRRAA
jgi:cysteine desulfurase